MVRTFGGLILPHAKISTFFRLRVGPKNERVAKPLFILKLPGSIYVSYEFVLNEKLTQGNMAKSSPYMLPTSYSEQTSHVRSVLTKISDALLSKEGWFHFPTESSDGRTNSQQGESQVAEFLLNHPSLSGLLVKKDVKKGKATDEDNRAFGDIGIDISRFGHNKSFPCNIKIISETNKAGNNACGLTNLIGYTFGKKCSNHDDVMRILIDTDKNGYDNCIPLLYGLIMVQKENKKCWTGTFDEVPEKFIGTNPSNPLQVPFLTTRDSRTNKEYITLLIKKIVEYHTKKSKPLALWSEYQLSKKAQ